MVYRIYFLKNVSSLYLSNNVPLSTRVPQKSFRSGIEISLLGPIKISFWWLSICISAELCMIWLLDPADGQGGHKWKPSYWSGTVHNSIGGPGSIYAVFHCNRRLGGRGGGGCGGDGAWFMLAVDGGGCETLSTLARRVLMCTRLSVLRSRTQATASKVCWSDGRSVGGGRSTGFSICVQVRFQSDACKY